nr:hypothetical protein [Tanacetum cinerariifolium]
LQENQVINQGGERQANQFGRLEKVEFLKLQRDVRGWAFRCDQFFIIYNTPNKEKEVYKNAIIQRFGSIFEDPIFALRNDTYEKNAREYQDLFDTLLCRVTISQEHGISLYLGGLLTALEMIVKMFKHVTLAYAYSLTTLQKAIIEAFKKKKKNKPSWIHNVNIFRRLLTELEMIVKMFKHATLAYAYSLTTLQKAIIEAIKKKKKNKPSWIHNVNIFRSKGYYRNNSKPTVLPLPASNNGFK